jgi:hypothetical protein
MEPDRQQPLKPRPLRGGAYRAGLDRLPPAQSGLSKHAKTDWGRDALPCEREVERLDCHPLDYLFDCSN